MTIQSTIPCTAIVCAYNEEKTVAGVVEALRLTRYVDEVIVVDDGSTDGTSEVLRGCQSDPKVRVLRLETNQGKGCALAEGIQAARGPLLLFVDADLLNWDACFGELVLEALLDGRAAMTIGYPLREGDKLDVLDGFGLIRGLSGERALWREDILPLLPALRESRFGAETLMNLHYRKLDKPVQIVPLPGLVHPVKVEKERLPAALRSYGREAAEISRTLRKHSSLALAAFELDGAGLGRRWQRTSIQARAETLAWMIEALEAVNRATGRWKVQLESQKMD